MNPQDMNQNMGQPGVQGQPMMSGQPVMTGQSMMAEPMMVPGQPAMVGQPVVSAEPQVVMPMGQPQQPSQQVSPQVIMPGDATQMQSGVSSNAAQAQAASMANLGATAMAAQQKTPVSPNRDVPTSTQSTLLISELRDNVVIMKDGSFRAVVACKSINFDLMSDMEREG